MASVTGTRRGARSSAGGGRRISGWGRRCSIWRSGGGGGAVGAGGSRTAPAFEVGGVPTRPFELKPSSRELLGERRFTASGAITQGRVGHFLQLVFSEAASAAFIGVNWHR